MRNFVLLVCVCGAVYILLEWQSVRLAFNEKMRAGTLHGVETCVAYSKSELMSAEATRNLCVESFQRYLYNHDFASGRAGPTVYSGRVSLDGSLENKTSDHVTTWVELFFSLYDSDGKEKKYWADTYIWIEPQSTADFRVELPGLKPGDVEAEKFCAHDDTSPTSCMAWGVEKIKGIKI